MGVLRTQSNNLAQSDSAWVCSSVCDALLWPRHRQWRGNHVWNTYVSEVLDDSVNINRVYKTHFHLAQLSGFPVWAFPHQLIFINIYIYIWIGMNIYTIKCIWIKTFDLVVLWFIHTVMTYFWMSVDVCICAFTNTTIMCLRCKWIEPHLIFNVFATHNLFTVYPLLDIYIKMEILYQDGRSAALLLSATNKNVYKFILALGHINHWSHFVCWFLRIIIDMHPPCAWLIRASICK